VSSGQNCVEGIKTNSIEKIWIIYKASHYYNNLRKVCLNCIRNKGKVSDRKVHTQGENNFYHFFIPSFFEGNHRSPWHYLEDSEHGETTGLRDITWKTRSMGKPQVSVKLPGRLGAWRNHRSPWHYLEDSEHGETTGLRGITWKTRSMGKPQVSLTLPGRLEAWRNHRSPWHYLEDSEHGESTGLRDITWETRSMGKPQVSMTLPGRLGAWGNHRSPWHYLEDSQHGELLHHDHLLLLCVREVVVLLRYGVEHLGHVQQLDRVDRRLDQLHLVIQAQRLEPCTTNNKAWTLHNKLQN